MSTQHQDYLYGSRRKRLKRIYRFGGDANDHIPDQESENANKKISYPYYGFSNQNSNEIKSRSIWFYILLPFIVLFAIFLNPTLGISVAILSLASVVLFFWRSIN